MKIVPLLLCLLLLAACSGGDGVRQWEARNAYTMEDALEFMSEEYATPFRLELEGGGTAALEDYEGRILALFFTEAGYAHNADQFEVFTQDKYEDVFDVLIVVEGEGALEDSHGLPTAYDTDGSVFSYSCYYAEALPVLYIIDRGGTIRIPIHGTVNEGLMDTLMDYMVVLDTL